MGTFDADHRALRRLAGRQHGLVTSRQLIGCGFSKKRVRAMKQRGELWRMHRGVYLLGSPTGWLTPFAAAALAGGPGSAVTHRSGVYLTELLPLPAQPGPVHITVPGRHRVGDDRLVVHETKHLPHYEVREAGGIPVTSPTRTLIDFAGDDATDFELDRAVAEAIALGRTNRAALLRAAQKAAPRRGTGRLRGLLDDPRGPKKTRSRRERRLLSLLRDAGAPEPLTNHNIGRWEVDLYFPEFRLVVEVDAYNTHSSPWAFRRDRRKDAELQERGLSVLRIADEEIDKRPQLAVARVLRRLQQRRAVDDRGDVDGPAIRARGES